MSCVFGVLNLAMKSTDERTLEKWAASQKLFPWVAVAAPLTVRLFLFTNRTLDLTMASKLMTATEASVSFLPCPFLFVQACLSIFTGFSAYPPIAPDFTGLNTTVHKTAGQKTGTNSSLTT